MHPCPFYFIFQLFHLSHLSAPLAEIIPYLCNKKYMMTNYKIIQRITLCLVIGSLTPSMNA